MNIYIDESGNSGDNLLDKQGIFSISSVAFDKSIINELEIKLQSIFEKIPTAKNGDLKTGKTLGTKFEPFLLDTMNIILDYKFQIYSCIVEKKFMVAGLIVENFFDPIYNKLLDSTWTYPIPIKRELCNLFYNNISKETLDLCAIAFTKGELSNIQKAHRLIIAEISDIPFSFDVSKVLEGVTNSLSLISESVKPEDFIINSKTKIKGNVLRSPNISTYYLLLNRNEEFLINNGKQGSIIFDSSRQFDSSFNALYNQLVQAKKQILHTGIQPLYFGFEKIVSFGAEKSENHIGLQISDLIATSFVHVFKILEEGKENLTEYESFLFAFIFSLIEFKDIDCVVSDRLLDKFYCKIKLISENYVA